MSNGGRFSLGISGLVKGEKVGVAGCWIK